MQTNNEGKWNEGEKGREKGRNKNQEQNYMVDIYPNMCYKNNISGVNIPV